MNKKLLIGLGVVAAAGVGYYLWKRNKDSKDETKSGLAGVPCVNDCDAPNPCQRCGKAWGGKKPIGSR